MSEEMKKLVIDGTEFEIVDAAGRDRITVLENTTPSGGGLSIAEKNLILQLFNKAAYSEDDAETAYTALSNLWTGSYYSISWEGSGYTKSNSDAAVDRGDSFTSTITANAGKTIESVTVLMGGVEVVGAYSGGTITIPNVTGNIVITVTTAQMTVSSISAVYTQSGTVYDTDTLDSLKADLVVTGTFPDSSTAVIPATDYTLSGTLLEGTSSITVSYGSKTASFNVTVTNHGVHIASTPYAMSVSASSQSWNASTQTATLHSAGASNYPGVILNGLLYTLGDVYDKTVRLRCTATLTGACRLIFALGTYTSVNPANNGAARKASANIYEMTEAGTIDIDVTGSISELFPSTTVMTNYFGLGVIINGANGVTATVSDISVEVY